MSWTFIIHKINYGKCLRLRRPGEMTDDRVCGERDDSGLKPPAAGHIGVTDPGPRLEPSAPPMAHTRIFGYAPSDHRHERLIDFISPGDIQAPPGFPGRTAEHC